MEISSCTFVEELAASRIIGIYGLQMKMLMFGTILFLSGAVVLGSSTTPEVSKCDKSFGIENGKIENSQITASSQWDGNHAAIQGRLNYKKNGPKQGGWSARTNDLNQWLQIDLINKYNKVTRIATQGRNGADQWVTKYMLQYSNDRAHFQFHREEGKASYRVFTGNTDRDTVVTHHLNPPIRAHYVRFLPKSWHRHISMRVELYGCKVCNKPLGMEDGRISNGQISASSEWDPNHAAAIQGRLNFKRRGAKQGAWSARANNVNQWLQVDLGCQYTRVSHVATQGRNGYNQWVTRYMLQYGSNELHFLHYREHGQPDYKVFAGNTDRDTIVSHLLSSPVSARFIRFLPTAWHGHISMRVEIYGCGGCKDCHGALGMENRAISDSRISASSQWDANHAATQARLFYQVAGNKRGAWSARTNDANQWLQVQLHTIYKITFVATQGRNGVNQWVSKYMLHYSKDGEHFQYYRERGHNTNKEFNGNVDRDTAVYHELKPPITARYIQFQPMAWHRHISMRVEIYGCAACSRALGMQTHQIPDWQITSSSQWDANHAAIQGRLFFQAAGNKQGAWSARKNDINQWLQINLGCNGNTVTRVATQGRNAYNQWVTKYALQYSGDGLHFHFYKEKGQLKNKEFRGNNDRDTVVSHYLNPLIKAQYIRFRPIAWHGHISMRVELHGCRSDSK